MSKSLASGRTVAKLREVIGKSQSQFAAMLGVSKHTIISVENGRNQLSWGLARRIYIATGANLRKDLMHWIAVPGENYNKEYFDDWRSTYFPSDDKTARQQFDRLKFWIGLVFRAAAKPNAAGNADRLPAVCLSLVEWLENARKEFKLENRIDEILEDETRYVGQDRTPIWQFEEGEDYVKNLAARLGVPYASFKNELFKKHKPNDDLVIEDEFRRDWFDIFGLHEPLQDDKTVLTVCKTRKLLAKPKYWIEKNSLPTVKADAN